MQHTTTDHPSRVPGSDQGLDHQAGKRAQGGRPHQHPVLYTGQPGNCPTLSPCLHNTTFHINRLRLFKSVQAAAIPGCLLLELGLHTYQVAMHSVVFQEIHAVSL